MKKIFISFLALVLLAGCNSSKTEDIFAFKQKCLSAGEKLHKEVIDGMPGTILRDEYTYNPNLNTCLYFGGHIDFPSDLSQTGYWIYDSLTKEELYTFSQIDETVYSEIKSQEDFFVIKDQLFSNSDEKIKEYQ